MEAMNKAGDVMGALGIAEKALASGGAHGTIITAEYAIDEVELDSGLVAPSITNKLER